MPSPPEIAVPTRRLFLPGVPGRIRTGAGSAARTAGPAEVVALVLLSLLIVVAIAGPVLPPYSGIIPSGAAHLPPLSPGHLLGTDESALRLDSLRPDGMPLETAFGWGVLAGHGAGDQSGRGAIRSVSFQRSGNAFSMRCADSSGRRSRASATPAYSDLSACCAAARILPVGCNCTNLRSAGSGRRVK